MVMHMAKQVLFFETILIISLVLTLLIVLRYQPYHYSCLMTVASLMLALNC